MFFSAVWIALGVGLMSLMIVLFTASMLLVFALIMYGFNVALAIGLALLTYSLPTFGPGITTVVIESLNPSLLNTLVSLILAMFLAELIRATGVGFRIVESLEALNPRIAAITTPSLIGLLPMPAGAYVSATLVDPLYARFNLGSADKTFLNYWFRHIWVTVWPLYQSVILASAILDLSFSEIINYTWPIFIGSIIGGLIESRPLLKAMLVDEKHSGSYKGLLDLWPFIAIALMTIALNIPLPLSLAVVAMFFIAIYRPSREVLIQAWRYSLNTTVIALIIESMVFSEAIKQSGLASQLLSYLHVYADIAVFTIPFVMVVATGFEFTFVVLAFPAILPMLRGYRITLAFLGGFTGAMLSPSHACLVLSAKYFKSNLGEVYVKHLLRATVLTAIIIVAETIATSMI